MSKIELNYMSVIGFAPWYMVQTTEKAKEGFVRLYDHLRFNKETNCFLYFYTEIGKKIRFNKKYIVEILDNEGNTVIY